jgi:hypothetical protein
MDQVRVVYGVYVGHIRIEVVQDPLKDPDGPVGGARPLGQGGVRGAREQVTDALRSKVH